jgi:predicted  nucleic acid-binding Zn-ribbon protein
MNGHQNGVDDEAVQRVELLTSEAAADEKSRAKANRLAERKAQLKAEILSLKSQLQDERAHVAEIEHEFSIERRELYEQIGRTEKERNDAQWRVGELEAECERKNAEIENLRRRPAVEEEMVFQENSQRLEARRPSQQGDMDDMQSELHELSKRKYELDMELGRTREERDQAKHTIGDLENHVHYLEKELWIACEKKAELERASGNTDHLQHELQGLSGRARWLEEQCEGKQNRINELEHDFHRWNQYRDMLKRQMNDAFLIKKEPYVDRNKWLLSMWNEDDSRDYCRTWFEIEPHLTVNAHTVYLIGSFVNWECALMCTLHPHGKYGVWVDLPRARYEFRFMVDGHWVTSDRYGKLWNDYGTENNWRVVEHNE